MQIDAGVLDIDVTGATTIDSSAGVSIDAATDSNLTVTGSGQDLDIAVSGGGAQELRLTSAGTGASALQITTTAGGIDITNGGAASGEDLDITSTNASLNLSAGEAVADAIVINASNAAGGIDIDAGTGGIAIGTSAAIRTTNICTGNAAQTMNIGSDANPVNIITLGGTASQLGFYGATPVVRASAITNATGNSASTNQGKINDILTVLRNLGLITS